MGVTLATIYDIAKALGVTAATVSYALSGKGAVSEETRARIVQYAQELGYRPNLVARSLVLQQTCTIGLIVPRISNPFYAEVAEAVERTARGSDFRVFFVNTDGDEELGQELVADLVARRVDGLIAMGGAVSARAISTTAGPQIPVVYCMWEEGEQAPAPRVDVDFRAAGRLAAEHLLAKDHERIAIVADGPDSGPFVHHLRIAGCRDALARAGRPLDPALLYPSDSTIEGGVAAGRDLLALPHPPTAIFATNDLMALGVMAAARQQGLRVPDDLSVVGFDDIGPAAHSGPPLTTLRIDKAALMAAATGLLLGAIDGHMGASPPPFVPTLVVRESTGSPAGPQSSCTYGTERRR